MRTTKNEGWGFFGTIHQLYPRRADTAWEAAFKALEAVAGTHATPEGIRYFLDSRYGRHFADDVLNENAPIADAIAAAVKRWQGWKANRKLLRELDAPRAFAGAPYLYTLLVWATVQAEFQA